MAYASIDATALAGRRVMYRCPIRQQWRRRPRGAPRLSTPPAWCMLCMLRWQVSAWCVVRVRAHRRERLGCAVARGHVFGTVRPWGGHGGGDPRFGDELPGYGSCARAGGLGRDCGRAGNCGGRARQAWSCAVRRSGGGGRVRRPTSGRGVPASGGLGGSTFRIGGSGSYLPSHTPTHLFISQYLVP